MSALLRLQSWCLWASLVGLLAKGECYLLCGRVGVWTCGRVWRCASCSVCLCLLRVRLFVVAVRVVVCVFSVCSCVFVRGVFVYVVVCWWSVSVSVV